MVDRRIFERVLHEQRVYLQKEDYAYLFKRFPGEKPLEEVDYLRLSAELNLHNTTVSH
jgi:hypothetical protein